MRALRSRLQGGAGRRLTGPGWRVSTGPSCWEPVGPWPNELGNLYNR